MITYNNTIISIDTGNLPIRIGLSVAALTISLRLRMRIAIREIAAVNCLADISP